MFIMLFGYRIFSKIINYSKNSQLLYGKILNVEIIGRNLRYDYAGGRIKYHWWSYDSSKPYLNIVEFCN